MPILHCVVWRRLWIAWLVITLPAVRDAFGADSYFRRDGGVAAGTAPLPEDLDRAAELRWRVEMAPGHSTPILAGDRIVLTTYDAARRELATVAVASRTGQLLWRQVAFTGSTEPVHRVNGSPAAATPACDGENVYVFFGSYGLIAYDLNGVRKWEHRLGPFQDEYGASSSPVVVDDKLFLCEDHDVESFLLALDKNTGRTLWRAERPEAVRSYSTPAVWTRNGQKELLVAGALELAGYDLETGEKRWWVHGLARIVIPVPVVLGDTIYMASWTPGGDPGKRLALDPWARATGKWDRDHNDRLSRQEISDPEVLDRFTRMDLDKSGELDAAEWDRHAQVFRRAQNALLAIRPDGQGDLTEKALLWKYLRGIPYVATPVVHEGIVWMVKDGGIVTKLDAASGQLLQEERLPDAGSYFASPVIGDGKVFFASELGTVSVVAERRDWRVLTSRDFHEKIYATPALSSGRIFLRTEQALYCFSK